MIPFGGGTGESSDDLRSNPARGVSRFGVERKQIKIDERSESYYQVK